jgi:hypothetical protein
VSTSIPVSFVKQYEAEVFEAYQRQGSKLRNSVRTKAGVKGASTIFQKAGKGTATQKARHGVILPMNVEHSTVEVFLQDWYAGDWVDKLDEYKINHDERQVLSNAGAYALGRKTDELIMAAIVQTTNTVGDGTTGLSRNLMLEAFEKLGAADVPDDGQRYGWVGWHQWSELMTIEEFANADYVGADQLPWPGTQAKRWLGTTWMPHSGLPLSAAGVRSCLWYHRSAVGHAIGADVSVDITWHGDRAAHFINHMMSQGAGLIDDTGVIVIQADDDADLPS